MGRTSRPFVLRLVLIAIGILAALGGCQDRRSTAKAESAGPATTLSAPPTARFVKLEEVTEWNGKSWAAMAEFNLVDATGADVDRHGWTVSADSAGVSEFPANAIDGDPKSLWHTRWQDGDQAPPPPHRFVVALGAPVRLSAFRYLPRQDGNANGTIAQYRFYVSDDGINWGTPVAEGDFKTGGSPTTEKTVVFAAASPNHQPVVAAPIDQRSTMGQVVSLPLAATDPDGDAMRFAATGLPPGLSIAPGTGIIGGTPITPGDYAVVASATDQKGDPVTVAFKWTIDAPIVDAEAARPAGTDARFVKLETLSEINGRAWSSIAELDLVGANGTELPRTGWVVSADSSDTSDRPANAIDGNPATVWHTQWDGASPPPPHSFIVDLGHREKLMALRVLPRQDASSNGVIARFRVLTSNDGVTWGPPIAEGDFSTMGPVKDAKTVTFR